jgi:hypothetical protein
MLVAARGSPETRAHAPPPPGARAVQVYRSSDESTYGARLGTAHQHHPCSNPSLCARLAPAVQVHRNSTMKLSRLYLDGTHQAYSHAPDHPMMAWSGMVPLLPPDPRVRLCRARGWWHHAIRLH